MDKLNISSLDYTVSEDLKVLLQMVGKQTPTSKHPCPYCMTSPPDFQKADHYTLESLCRLCDQWMTDGANLKRGKKLHKCCSSTFINRRQKQKSTRACKYFWSTYTARCYRQNFKGD